MNTIINNKLDCLVKFFDSLKFEKYYYHRYPGNNGDDLIDLGAQIFFKKYRLNLVNKIEDSDCIILCGGGGIVKQWLVGIEFLSFVNTQYPKIPIIVLPSSLGEGDLDLVENFEKRTAPFYIWAREEYTYRILNDYSLPNFYVGLSHDMAFLAKNSEKLKEANHSAGYILIVERFDAEHNHKESEQIIKGFNLRNSKLARCLKKFIPLEIKRMIKRNFRKPSWRKRDFVEASLKEIYNDYPQAKNLKVMYCDISLSENASFDQFIKLVKGAAFISTMRLHVGILGYLCVKPTYFRLGESIPHKIQGVYEYSLRHSPSVKVLKD
jgi:exopolysaccharide biosynthesis predicted pyruvyltransferase EpsI